LLLLSGLGARISIAVGQKKFERAVPKQCWPGMPVFGRARAYAAGESQFDSDGGKNL